MNDFNDDFNHGEAQFRVSVNDVEHRRNVGRALMMFRALRDSAIDLGRGRRAATIAAAAAVTRTFPGVDLMAALGLDASSGAHSARGGIETGEGNGGRGAPPPRSRDPNAIFVNLPDAEIGPDFADALDRLAELWRDEPDAPREAGDEPFLDDDSLRAAGVPPNAMTARLLNAMAREERFSATGWTSSPELDHDHGSHRAAMLAPAFIQAFEDFQSLMLSIGFGCGAVRPSTRDVYLAAPAAIAAAVALDLEHVPAGAMHFPGSRSELFSVPWERIEDYLRRAA